jgi:hypothetical protein
MTAGARLAGLVLLALLFLGVAFWNRFPLVFYDTGAYMAEGLEGAFFVERSPVYSLLLPLTGASFSLWWTATAQALMTAFLVLELARAEVPRLRLGGLLLIGAALMGLTGIGWYVGQIEPDCFTPLVVIGGYLLLFRADAVLLGAGGVARRPWANSRTSLLAPGQPPKSLASPSGKLRLGAIVAVTALAVAAHPSHLGLIGGLLLCAAMLWRFHRRMPLLPRPRLLPCLSALLLALTMTMGANYAFTRTIFISRAGSVFLLARLMQDGIVQRLMADVCPPRGSGIPEPYTLCAYRTRLPRNANAWLWGEHSSFRAEGGFKRSDGEYSRIVRDSLVRYPWMHLKAAALDSMAQFLQVRTGDGIESQRSILRPVFRHALPRQLPAYLAARQQTRIIRFRDINLIHVPVAMISLLGLLLLLHHAAVRRRWGEAALPATVLLALIGNAVICGTFSNPHDRYQSRLIWVPALVLLLARARDPKALQPVSESGT